MPKISKHAKNIPEAEERRGNFVLDTAQDHGNNVSRLLFISATLPLVLRTHKFVLSNFYLFTRGGKAPESRFRLCIFLLFVVFRIS